MFRCKFMMFAFKLSLLGVCLYFTLPLFGQEEKKTDEEQEYFRHRISVAMANVRVPSADNVNQQSSFYILPTWAINYDYWFSRKFALGLHSDFALQKYEVSFEESVITRSHPVVVSAVGLFKATRHWTFLFGAGREFEASRDFNLIRFGTEYGIEIQNNWEINFNLVYDQKINAYDAIMFGFGASKKLR